MKIAFFEVPKEEQSFFSQAFSGAEVSFFEEKLTEHNAEKAKDAEILSVFINSIISKSVIELLPNLKFITTRSTGFEHTDLEYCATKGILVSNVPSYGSHTVAEFAFSLILNLSRKIINANNHLRDSMDFNFYSSLQGFDLDGKTLGVIGTGKIGKNSIKIGKGFGMNIVAYDLFPDLAFAKENNFTYKSLLEVLGESDIVTIHTPYTKENHHLINKENISKMKKGILVINTARGALVDTEALIWGINEGIIAGAGLDVLEGERDLKIKKEIIGFNTTEKIDYKIVVEDQVLIDMPQVIVTPHIAFYSKEAVREITKTTIENIEGFIQNQPKNLVK
ncbi:MAG: NAD(P)-dependent oxidoreductase [Candidatus Pacebacteria bacterium]|nr:NAD(P)-dependent oxidoreductase [Candidatus Paceibacterota bacterium]